MAYTTEPELAPGRGIEWFAGQLHSPVVRLRFLQEFAPRRVDASSTKGQRSWLLAVIPVLFLLGTAPPRPRVEGATKVITPRPAVAPERAAAVVETAGEVWIV